MDASGHVQDHQHVIGHHGFYAHHGYMMGVYGDQMIMQQHHQIHEGSGQGYPHPHQHHMDGVPLPPGIPGLGASTDPLEAVLGPFPCAHLQSLPFDATLEDILVLFQGLVVIDVAMMGSGEAFVVFANPMDYQMALQRDRQTIGRNFVEIRSGSRSDYYSAIASQQWRDQQGTTVLSISESILGGSDREISTADTSNNVWGSVGLPAPIQHQALPQPPIRTRGADPPADPPAQVSSLASVASSSRGREGPGSGLTAQYKRTGGGIQIGEHTGFLRMRGLPFSAAKEDIAKFFQEFNPIPDSIVLTYRSDGRATGEAYVGFEAPEDSKRAMELHRRSMGNRYIELFLSNKEEHGRALVRFGNR